MSYQGYAPRGAQASLGVPAGYHNDAHDPYHEAHHMCGGAHNVAEPDPYGLGQRHQARPHDTHYSGFVAASPHGGQAQSPAPVAQPVTAAGVAQGLGAVLSLVLLISGGVWAFQMMQRDVSGVPVVRALEGPLRVTPDNPGGSQAAHQGLSVTELAADGPSTLPDEIVLAPPPLNLDRDVTSPARNQSIPSGGEDGLIEVGLPLAETANVADVADVAPLGIVSPNRLAVTRSPRPNPRGVQFEAQRSSQPAAPTEADDDLAAVIANSVAADLSRGGGVDIDPASIGPGTRLVQLGTYDSADQARSAWDGLAQRFDPLLDDRGRVIEAAHSGGSVFYRLRAHGFNDERDARQFCAALIDQKMDCIPVMIR